MTNETKAPPTTSVAVPIEREMPGQICSLPLLGPTTVEDLAFYSVLGVVTVVKLVAWPTAALVGTAHVLHQRARNLSRYGHERGEFIEGALEGTEELL